MGGGAREDMEGLDDAVEQVVEVGRRMG